LNGLDFALTYINVRPLISEDFNRIGECLMADSSKVPVKSETSRSSEPEIWGPFEGLRREVDRIFDGFGGGFWRSPFRGAFDLAPLQRLGPGFGAMPAVDVSETDKAYEITAELPGMDEKSIEVKLSDGVLTIKGEKQDEKEENKKDYYMRERSFGSFQRSFQVPEGVDTDRIEASFKKGILSVTLPKSAQAQKAAKKITIKSA
jgi:HSP20 family protein